MEIGRALSSVYAKLFNDVTSVFEHNIAGMTKYNELFIGVYEAVLNHNEGLLKDIILKERLADLETMTEINVLRKFDPDFTTYSRIVLESDLSDLRYLFKYGVYISDNEIESAKYLNSVEEEKIRLMANVYTEGFRKGYVRDNKDMSKKASVNLGYSIGFERVTKEAISNFAKMNLKPLIFTDAMSAQRPRIEHTLPSRQFAYDHRFDEAIFFNEDYTTKMEAAYGSSLKKHEAIVRVMAGPAVQESFGEKPFSPISKSSCIKYNDDQTELKNSHNTAMNREIRNYLPRSEYGFVIIAYPLPEIGEKYTEIFDEIIKVNTLDSDLYEAIQEKIITALDKGEYVHVLGANGNETDIKVMLHNLRDDALETNFENCVADVNIPVGEVFTSPVLKGTNGILHVKEVYLFGLKYENFKMVFEDGMIKDYACTNFENEADNKKYIHENIMHPHDTLPIGEFAIGTNTTAYVMANKYKINKLLPILIAEKMGPHFAVGDTCFSWSEDLKVCNRDGKEIIAKDNEKSILRKEDISKAYTFKHTDITIPYEELKSITVVNKAKESIEIIKDGRFILEGTEELNKPFTE
jgi:leucyl aminopeptidase (aminopeptidase T)